MWAQDQRIDEFRSPRSSLKRSTDLSVALLALIVTLPVTAVAALAIKLSSAGPVIYRSRRVGRSGTEFEMLKFRTMYTVPAGQSMSLRDPDDAAGFVKAHERGRVTPLGRTLRRTSLDELPQLVNVVKGEMSLVGPRPLIPAEDRQIPQWQRRRRYDLVPGVTGVWQLSPWPRPRLSEMVAVDCAYGDNWSYWRDVKILGRTLVVLMRAHGQ